MTGITTAAGTIPLIFTSGAGAETRMVIGVVVLAGILSATLFTLFIVPVAYALLAKGTSLPSSVARRLQQELALADGKSRKDRIRTAAQ
jgi:multidrug efflux pump